MTEKELFEMANRVIKLEESMVKTFGNAHTLEKRRLAIMAGLLDAYNRGKHDYKESLKPNVQFV